MPPYSTPHFHSAPRNGGGRNVFVFVFVSVSGYATASGRADRAALHSVHSGVVGDRPLPGYHDFACN